jgi:3-methyladenine DNA glycosylase/8-oxoguanine DNA glycosylase
MLTLTPLFCGGPIVEIILPANLPFSLPSVVRSHGWIQLDPFWANDYTAGFGYILQLDSGRVVEMGVQEVQGGVSVAVEGSLDAIEKAELSSKVAWMLGLDQDFTKFYALAQAEPKLAQAAKEAKGRILRSATLFEDVIKTILTTNTLWAATIRMNRNLVDQFGSPLPTDSARYAFPTPERLAATDESTLRTLTRLGYRAPYVLNLARQVASGNLDLEEYRTADLPTLELRKELMAIKGVGPYAAANLLMLLGHYDFIPVDSWAIKMVSHEWYNDEPVGKAQVEAAFEHWGQWKGLAYWLWGWSYNSD